MYLIRCVNLWKLHGCWEKVVLLHIQFSIHNTFATAHRIISPQNMCNNNGKL